MHAVFSPRRSWLCLATSALCLWAGAGALHGTTNFSKWALPGATGRILRVPDALGNTVLDYSMVGYRNGTVPIPEVPVKVTISPVAGDDGASIQAAINTVKALPLDANGFRGAVLLTAGEYDITGSVTINASGIVLRGVGDGTDGTVLRATGTNQRSLVLITGSGSASTVSGTTHNITDNYVPVGARSFNVDSTSGLAVGDRVFVRRIATDQWIQDLGMDLLGPGSGGDVDDVPWTASGYHMDFDRVITRIEGNRIMIDAPITCAIEARYAGGTIRKYTWSGRIQNCGVEDIRGVSDYTAADDENHGWTLFEFRNIEHGWARRVTSRYFGYSCVALLGGTRCVTVRDSTSLDPISIITGGRRYAFVMDDCQLCLVQSCYTLKDRHQFVTQSVTTGPNVFVDGVSDTAYSDAGPHHRWATGAIWDRNVINGDNINVQNRGNLGTGHGWAGANMVVWNCKADGYVVQNPPTARNWLIGSVGAIQNGTVYVGPHDPGTYDSHGSNVFPNSLYYAQLQDRLAAPRVESFGYAVGEINQFTNSSPAGTAVPVDAAWRAQVEALAAGAPLSGFDLVTNAHFVPFTFNFVLSATNRLVGASLALAMRASAGYANEVLYLDDTNNARSFSSLGWLPIGTGTNTTVRVLDLGDQLSLLADGKLNLAVADDVGIDWARLELHAAPVQTLVTNIVPPVADTFVRGGTGATLNYGSNTTLDIKLDTAADNQRLSYLRWNVAGYSTRLQHARVRLVPTSVGTNGLEHAAALAKANYWNQNDLTWNSQPGYQNRFASWIPATGVPVEFVVTPQVQAALQGDGQLSLALFSLKNAGGPGLASYASSEDPNPANRPQLILVYSNTLPVISSILDQTISSDTNTGPLAFTIGDPAYAVNLLTLGATSSDTNVIPASGIALGGSLSNRTVTVTPVPGAGGTVQVTVIVTNPAGMTAGSQFAITVTNSGSATGTTPASGNWALDLSGDWNTSANWVGGIIATGISQQAVFGVDVTASRLVNNRYARVIGNLVFTDPDPDTVGSWTFTNQPLTLQLTNGTPSVGVTNTTANLNCVVAGTQGMSKTGGGTLVLGGANTFSGAVSIQQGAVRAAHSTALGSTASGASIGNDPTARLELAGGITVAEPITISCKGSANGNVPAVLNVSQTNTLSGALTFTTGGSYWTFEAASGKLRVSGQATNITTTNVRLVWLRGAAEGEWLTGIHDSAGGLGTAVRKDDPGLWTMSGDSTYSGATTVSNGILRVQGSLGPSVVSVYGGSLAGSGVFAGPVSISSGATLAPALPGLTISNALTLQPGSVLRMEINAAAGTVATVRGLDTLSLGGALAITNVAGQVLPGKTFDLFDANSTTGNFSALPAPAGGIYWSFVPVTGVLTAMALPKPALAASSSAPGQVVLSITNGIPGSTVIVLSATNAALPAVSWTPVSTNVFGPSGSLSWTNAVDPASPRKFFQAVLP